MEDMRKFEKPEMEVIVFEAEDIITSSQGTFENGTGQSNEGPDEGATMDISEFMSDGAGDITEPAVPASSAGTAEAADSPADSNVVDESVIEDEPVIEEPVMTEEVVEDIAIE